MSGSTAEERHSGRVLVVEDDPDMRRLVSRFLARLRHDVETAGSVSDAWSRLSDGPYDLVVTDLQLPDGSGLELIAEIRPRWPETRTILMSGRADAADAAAAIERGVDGLLLKPFRFEEMEAAVEKALTARHAQARAIRDRERVESLLREKSSESRVWILRSAHALAAAVEAKDAYTAGHAARVTAYALTISEVLGGIDSSRFRLASDLHDVGKIGVPDAVLNKPARLTAEEFELIRRHPEAGERILQPLIDDSLVLGVVRSHHERWDGNGYPDGLRQEEIPLVARILAAADTLDAITSNRAYRTALSWNRALQEIRRCAGTQFDPTIVQALADVSPALRELCESFRKEVPGARFKVQGA